MKINGSTYLTDGHDVIIDGVRYMFVTLKGQKLSVANSDGRLITFTVDINTETFDHQSIFFDACGYQVFGYVNGQYTSGPRHTLPLLFFDDIACEIRQTELTGDGTVYTAAIKPTACGRDGLVRLGTHTREYQILPWQSEIKLFAAEPLTGLLKIRIDDGNWFVPAYTCLNGFYKIELPRKAAQVYVLYMHNNVRRYKWFSVKANSDTLMLRGCDED